MKLRFPKDDADRFLIIAVAVVLLFILLFFAGCKTKETYLIILESDQPQTRPVCNKETIYVNRFKKQFNRADSTFMDNLRKASKEAREAANKQVYLK